MGIGQEQNRRKMAAWEEEMAAAGERVLIAVAVRPVDGGGSHSFYMGDRSTPKEEALRVLLEILREAGYEVPQKKPARIGRAGQFPKKLF